MIPPPNILWYNVSSTSIKSTWDPIPPHLCNGILIGYNLSFWKQSDPQNFTNVIVSEEVKLFSWLEKWTFYCGQVVAFTKIGEGPRSQVDCIQTSEDGNWSYVFKLEKSGLAVPILFLQPVIFMKKFLEFNFLWNLLLFI